MKGNKIEIDQTAKIVAVILVIAVVYAITLMLITPVLVPQQQGRGMIGMMQAFNPYYNSIATTVALIPALVIGLAVAVSLKTREKKYSKEMREISEYKVLKRAMSGDERMMYEAVKTAGKITQDSLRSRLVWTKAKTSRILTNLDKMNLVQRERAGKTYNVFIQKNKK